MASWVNKGSYQDISHFLPGDPVAALVPTSQEGGNQQASNEQAMTAPGSQPVNILLDRDVQVDPTMHATNSGDIPPGTDGKPQARGEDWSPPGRPAWGYTIVDDVTRNPAR